MRPRWLENMKIYNWMPTVNNRLCSKHFDAKNFYVTNSRVRLMNKAVPTIFVDLPSNLQPANVIAF